MLSNTNLLPVINSPVRHLYALAELYNGSAKVGSFRENGEIISFTIERIGDNQKFFGYGICQRLNIKLIDAERALNITTANSFNVTFGGVIDDQLEMMSNLFPAFYVSEVHRDENTNALSVTAYDAIYKASTHTVAEIALSTYTIQEFAAACAALLGLEISILNVTDSSFETSYVDGANFDGTETIREALDAVAEATQTIYYIDSQGVLVFKRLALNGDPVITLDKEKYFTLKNSDNRRLSTICHATELGDNVSVSITELGSTQYIRNNPFWEMRDDIATLVDNALTAAGGLTINQFNCEWRGNFLVEIGDRIALITKDDATAYSYLLDDTISYDGAYTQKTQWSYSDNDTETASNPTSLGDAIKQTYARVDKANKQIELVASDTAANSEDISSLILNTESITATVRNIETNTNEAIDNINGDIETLQTEVQAKVSAEDVTISIKSEIANGVNKVTTNTGFTFNDEGLTVEKSDSEMRTQITEDGMTVYKNNDAVLVANNVGVNAVNLHATTYLIIGTNSRFEDYGDNRTGCFYIGG